MGNPAADTWNRGWRRVRRGQSFGPALAGAGEWVDDHCLVAACPPFEQKLRGRPVCGERRMHPRGIDRRVRAYRRRSAHARDRQRLRRRTPGLPGRGNALPRVRGVRRASPARRGAPHPYSGYGKGDAENAVGFPSPQPHGSAPGGGTHERPARLMPERCDELGKGICRRTSDPIDGLFADDLKALCPLPSRRFAPVRRETRRADRYGCVEIDPNRYDIGPDMRGRRPDIAIRATRITVRDDAGRTVADLERVHGGSPRTIQDPGKVFPLLASKPRVRRDRPIRLGVPDDVKTHLDRADGKTSKARLKAFGRACEAASLEPAMRAVFRAIGLGRDIDAREMSSLARRVADGDIGYGDDPPGLNEHDTFSHPGRGNEWARDPSPGFP